MLRGGGGHCGRTAGSAHAQGREQGVLLARLGWGGANVGTGPLVGDGTFAS